MATANPQSAEASVYDQYAPLLIALGLCPLPIEPGGKRPAMFVNGKYALLLNWTERQPVPAPQPGAGVGLRTGDKIVGVDIDTDDDAIGCAIIDAIMPPGAQTITKVGKRGQTLFFRLLPGQRVASKQFRIGDKLMVEILATGRQTVLPPTIHPDTKRPYVWGNGATLFNTDLESLPLLPVDAAERIEAALQPFGYREDTEAPLPPPSDDSPFKELNQYAQANLSLWVPKLGLLRYRGWVGQLGGYRAVAHWRPSSTGRKLEDRAYNLKINKRVIFDQGTKQSYSPINLVMAARGLDFSAAVKWLEDETGWSKRGPEVDFEAIAEKAKEPNGKAGNDSGDAPGGGAKGEKKYRFKLTPFWELRPGIGDQDYLIDDLIPSKGIAVLWGAPKCFKSFFMYNAMFHVAKGWEFAGRAVQAGPVIYCAFEGGHGYGRRTEALRKQYDLPDDDRVPVYTMRMSTDLIKDHVQLAKDLYVQLSDAPSPVAIVLDTLNKSLVGSESKDADMQNYIRAAEAIRDKFQCVVIIIHHCGWDESRERGHSSLRGAVDALLSAKREGMCITVTVDHMRDGAEGLQIVCDAHVLDVDTDKRGHTVTSLAIVPREAEGGEDGAKDFNKKSEPVKFSIEERLALAVLDDCIKRHPVPVPGGHDLPGLLGTGFETWRLAWANDRNTIMGHGESGTGRFRKQWSRMLNRLKLAKAISVAEGVVWRPLGR